MLKFSPLDCFAISFWWELRRWNINIFEGNILLSHTISGTLFLKTARCPRTKKYMHWPCKYIWKYLSADKYSCAFKIKFRIIQKILVAEKYWKSLEKLEHIFVAFRYLNTHIFYMLFQPFSRVTDWPCLLLLLWCRKRLYEFVWRLRTQGPL